uniref:uncharacterized protein LOC122597042 n=1 Tax=Erigeron canadensis TaxID=72917 RepID=UPI001CB97BF7|nr:uncharacterized protein LOC122597042 [Erigeron canadensis]
MAPMSTARIEKLIAQRLAEALASAEAAREIGSGSQNGTGSTPARLNNGQESFTFRDFQYCKPQSFHGIEGTVGLLRWFEKMETVFRISNCANGNRVKYATGTLLDSALTWWNTYAQTVGLDTAYETPWVDLKRMMTEEYCPRTEIQKLEVEFWNLKVKGTNL